MLVYFGKSELYEPSKKFIYLCRHESKAFWIPEFVACFGGVDVTPVEWASESSIFAERILKLELRRESILLPPIPENEGSSPSEVVALYDYSAERPEELSLVKGNIYIFGIAFR
ncbi:hypothetical protein MHYP_G00299550 [Metynnis hypsauchen]